MRSHRNVLRKKCVDNTNVYLYIKYIYKLDLHMLSINNESIS